MFDPAETSSLLARTPGVLRELLTDLPEAWLHADEGGESGSAFTIRGHLAQIARVLAKAGGEAVGPWRAYLPVLTDRS